MNSKRCPICERAMPGNGPQDWPKWPFCSSRCQLVDLGRWLGESYAVEAAPGEDPEDPDTPAGSSAVPHRDEA